MKGANNISRIALLTVIMTSVWMTSAEASGTNLSAWQKQLTPAGQGTVLKIYPQDSTVSLEESTLEKVESILFPQIFQDGPRDMEMINKQYPVKASHFTKVNPGSREFSAVHAYAVTRLVFNMWRSSLQIIQSAFPQDTRLNAVIQYWDSLPYKSLNIYPYGIKDVKNAYYCRQLVPGRTGNNFECELKFGYFRTSATHQVATCEETDIVAHEASHAALDRMRPSFYDTQKVQTAALHEAVGDLGAFFYVISNPRMAAALVTATTNDLHSKKNFAAHLAEEFGSALGLSNGLRNIDDDLTMSEVSDEPHEASQVVSGACFDAFASAFKEAYMKKVAENPDTTHLLQLTGKYAHLLITHAVATVESDEPSFSDLAKKIVQLSKRYKKSPPAIVSYVSDLDWKKYFKDEFKRRGVALRGEEDQTVHTFQGKKSICGMQQRLRHIPQVFVYDEEDED
jgi:hypothetical protein